MNAIGPLARSIAVLEVEARMCEEHVLKLTQALTEAPAAERQQLLALCGEETRWAAGLRAKQQIMREQLFSNPGCRAAA